MEKSIERQLGNLVVKGMTSPSLKIMGALDRAGQGLSCGEIIMATGLNPASVKSWIKNNLYREKKPYHKITQIYPERTKGQKYILSRVGKIMMEQFNKKPTTMNTTESDVFSLLGVERKPREVHTEQPKSSSPAILRYEEMLIMIERKKFELNKAEEKVKQMISALSNLASVEKEISSLLGQPIGNEEKPQPKKVSIVSSKAQIGSVGAGGMKLNPKTASILAFIAEKEVVTPKQIAEAAKAPAGKITNWIWNAFKSRGKQAYIQKDEYDRISVSQYGLLYLERCERSHMKYPKLTDGYTTIPLGNGQDIENKILALLEHESLDINEIVKKLNIPKGKVRKWVFTHTYGTRRYVKRDEGFKYSLTFAGKDKLKEKEEVV